MSTFNGTRDPLTPMTRGEMNAPADTELAAVELARELHPSNNISSQEAADIAWARNHPQEPNPLDEQMVAAA